MQPDDGYVYYVVQPPWVCLDKLQTFYTLRPEEQDWRTSHMQVRAPCPPVQASRRERDAPTGSQAGRLQLHPSWPTGQGHGWSCCCVPPHPLPGKSAPSFRACSQKARAADSDNEDGDRGGGDRAWSASPLTYSSRLKWGTNFVTGTASSALLGLGRRL